MLLQDTKTSPNRWNVETFVEGQSIQCGQLICPRPQPQVTEPHQIPTVWHGIHCHSHLCTGDSFEHAIALSSKSHYHKMRTIRFSGALMHTQFNVLREDFQTELARNDTHIWFAGCPVYARLDEACMFACKPSAPMFPFKALPARWVQHSLFMQSQASAQRLA